MKKTIGIIAIIVVTIVCIILGNYIEYCKQKNKIESFNKEFLIYKDTIVQIDKVISLMNRAIQSNIDNNITQNEKKIFEENDKNSIKIYLEVENKSKVNTIPMEELILGEVAGMEKVSYAFSDMVFEITNIEYHKNGQVKKITFTAIEEQEDIQEENK